MSNNPKADYWTAYLMGQPCTILVHEEEKQHYTGLLDENGHKLYRKPEKMGFIK